MRVPVRLAEDRPGASAVVSSTQISPPYELAAVSPLPVAAHEGNPAGKMGQSYVPNAGEDHFMKAQSVGERSQRTGTGMNAPAGRGRGDIARELDDPAGSSQRPK